MVEIRSNLLDSNLIFLLVDERFIHGILDKKWNELSSIHVRFIHELLFSYDVFLLDWLLLLFASVAFAFLSHQL